MSAIVVNNPEIIDLFNAGNGNAEAPNHQDTVSKAAAALMKTKETTVSLVDLQTSSVTFPDGSRYDGQMVAGVKSGTGRYVYSSGDIYDGEWKADKRHGQGTYAFQQGGHYDGEWVNGHMHGHGFCFYVSGDQYEGAWENSERHGWGTYSYNSGARYVGPFQHSRMHGEGTYRYVDGQTYVGEFANGVKHGYGVHSYPNGDTWRGEWVDDEPLGLGEFSLAGTVETSTCEFKKPARLYGAAGLAYTADAVVAVANKPKKQAQGRLGSGFAASDRQNEALKQHVKDSKKLSLDSVTAARAAASKLADMLDGASFTMPETV